MRAEVLTITVDGTEYEWTIEREPQWCTVDGWRGLAVAVKGAGVRGRRLLVEFPFATDSHRSTPHRQRPKVSVDELGRDIRAAIADGWSPTSKGKDYLFAVTGDA